MTENNNLNPAIFRELSDYALDAIIMTDMNLKILYANRSAHTMFGYADGEMMGQEATIMWLEEDLSTLQMALPQIMSGGFKGEVRNKCKDGTVLTVSSAAFPVGGGDGQPPTALAVFIRDITERKQAEESLRENETNLKEAQQLAQIGSWSLDLVSNRLEWSDEIYRIFEIDPAQFGASYEAFLNGIHPDDRDMVNQAYTESLQNRMPYQIEHRLLMPDGRIKFVQERCRTTYDAEGRPLRSLGTVHDITGRKQVEGNLQQSQQMLRQVLDNFPGVVFWKDQNLVYLGCNMNFAAAAGLSDPAQIVGKTDYDLPWAKTEAESYRADDQAVMESKTSKLGIIETQLQADGRVAWFDTGKTPLLDRQGNVVGILGTSNDITRYKRVEAEREQMLKEQRRLAAVLNNTTDLVGMIDMQGKSIYVNPAGMSMMGRVGQDPTSLVVTDFHPLEAAQRVQAEHLPAIMKNGHHTWENVLQHSDGHTIPVSQASLLIYNEAGEPEVMATIMRDISTQKQAMTEQERLQQEIIDAQRRALQELSTPIIPVMEHIIVMPLIGSIDSMRARDITRTLLAGIREHRAKVVILDITGVPLVDSGVASHLNKTIQAARLKGARTIITGVSDAVAETIVDLGIDWRGVETLADLQTGLVVALASLGVKLTKI